MPRGEKVDAATRWTIIGVIVAILGVSVVGIV